LLQVCQTLEDASDRQAKKGFFLRILKRGACPKRFRSDGVGANKKTVIPTNQFWLFENQTEDSNCLSICDKS